MPESVLKKRKRDTQWAAQKAAAAADAKKASEAKREEIFKRAEKYVKEYRDQVRRRRRRCDHGSSVRESPGGALGSFPPKHSGHFLLVWDAMSQASRGIP